MVRLAVYLLIGFLMLRWIEKRQVYHPTWDFDVTPATFKMAHEEVFFDAGDGPRLHGWFFPATNGSPRAGRVFLVCHGNGGNISHRIDLAQALLKRGAAVLLFDYRGYGRSTGSPSEEGTYRDAQAAHAWLRGKGFAPGSILLLGESLGGGVASELALREPAGGMVLQCSFTSAIDMGAEIFPWLPVRWLMTISYDTHGKLPRIHVPVLILHSRGDTLIPFRHAERNLEAANAPKKLVEITGDHNDPVWEDPAYGGAMEAFLGAY